MTVTGALLPGVEALAAISLAGLDEVVALRTRRDRKYIVDDGCAARLVGELGPAAQALDIDGLRSARIRSLYFDTPDLALHRAAALRRRHRFKVRTRRYGDDRAAVLEVKEKSGRGETVKHRRTHRDAAHDVLDADDRAFIDSITLPGASVELVPTLTTSYARTTLVAPALAVKITLDQHLRCTDHTGGVVSCDAVIVEIKSASGSSPFDRWLWSQGHRPEAFSKYCTALAVLHPELPSNRWHRTIRRHLS